MDALDFSPIKAILIDVDGTLIRSDKSISDSVLTAINAARTAGLTIGLCTGRHAPALRTIFEQIGYQDTHVVAGGAQVIEAAEPFQVLWERVISSADAQWLYQEITDRGGDMVLGKMDALYGYESFVKKLAEHPWDIPTYTLDELGDDWSTPLISIHQINQDIEDFLHAQTRVHEVAMVSSSGIPYYDATALNVTKREGVEEWARRTGFTLDQVMGIGDGLNDAEYLDAVGIAVAMANAEPEVTDLAQLTVAANDDDGVAEAIQHVLNAQI